MTDTLRDLLRQDAHDVEIPALDANDVIARGEQRLHRRRVAAALAVVTAVAVIAVGGVVAGNVQPQSQGPVDRPTRVHDDQRTVEPRGARPLVYADGTTVHVGDKTIEAEKPVAFIDATDDGAVYEASLDGTLWFTDGTTTSIIGTSGFAAAPTAHPAVVTTSDSGSLVVWVDRTRRKNQDTEFIVYDTSRREEVGRIQFTGREDEDLLLYVDEDRVYVTPDSGCWSVDDYEIYPCKHPHLFRFDVASGELTRVGVADLYAEMSNQSRMFKAVVQDGRDFYTGHVYFRQVGGRLATVTPGGDALTLSQTSGEQVRLRLPSGFTALGHEVDAAVIRTSQWLDDDHIVVWANGGGGDLPAQQGDLLVCPLPDGTCQVAVPRSSRKYVAP